MSRVAVIVFPGSNREIDVVRALRLVCGSAVRVELVSSNDHALPKEVSHVVLPGGFSYGDYLRGGVLAKVAPIMGAVMEVAKKGGHVLGICNGFQILTEVGLLEGGLMKNVAGKFICKQVDLLVERGGVGYFSAYKMGERVRFPIAHGEGRFVADSQTLTKLAECNQIVLRYCQDVNGSMDSIAGICSKSGRVVGFMPHPENAVGKQNEGASQDGERLFQAFAEGSSLA